ncbi:MAG: DegV family protein [Anaerolineales bacterium]|nr:DegV family protein [Anaerolineales bacterium]
MTVKIVTDSTCDLPADVVQSLGIDVVPLYINIGEEGYLDGVDISRTEFYTNLPDYPVHPTTGTPGIGAFTRTYEKLAAAGADRILSIHISKSLSATVDVARKAAEVFRSVPVTVLDSLQLSLGTGFQVRRAAEMARAGAVLEEILADLADMARRSIVIARLSTLEFLRRSGRLTMFMTGLGSLLKLKPILTMVDGVPTSSRVRTTQRAEEQLIKELEKRAPFEQFALVHTNAAAEAEAFRQRIERFLPEGPLFSMDITPVIGAHIGPGAVGFAAVSAR